MFMIVFVIVLCLIRHCKDTKCFWKKQENGEENLSDNRMFSFSDIPIFRNKKRDARQCVSTYYLSALLRGRTI